MRILRAGDRGQEVYMAQTALARWGADIAVDGIFGRATEQATRRFQSKNGLVPDGVIGPLTWRALDMYIMGYLERVLVRGDTYWRLAEEYGTTVGAIALANPALDPLALPIGATVAIPLPYDVTAVIPYSARLNELVLRGLAVRYPFLTVQPFGRSVAGSELLYAAIGRGRTSVIYNSSHHANEWITTPLLLKLLEGYAAAYAAGEAVYGTPAETLFDRVTLYAVPLVDPDGVDLVTGAFDTSSRLYRKAVRMADDYPQIPFPSGWKANIAGTDLNLNYPAKWEEAKRIKFEQGYTVPGPRDYVGEAPLSAPESDAMHALTTSLAPSLVTAWHTQGRVIFWRFGELEPERGREIAEAFSAASGYAVADAEYASSFAGYKDWFIESFGLPGYTIEAGEGVNPLPLTQFDRIYEDNEGIFVLGMTLA